MIMNMKGEKKFQQDYFGFLPCAWTIDFGKGNVNPLDDFEEVENWVNKYKNQDGFLYPPLSRTMTVDPSTMEFKEEIPNTERPAFLYNMPPSHKIIFYNTSNETEYFRGGPGGFIMHILGYLFGTRLQFKDWWFDGRVPIESTHNVYISKDTASEFLLESYNNWKRWNNKLRTFFTNILYMHSRSPSYEWDWERFAIEYMTFDACYKFAMEVGIISKKNVTHKDRIKTICVKFSIPINIDIIAEIVELRNGLFHEALWDGSHPCFVTKTSKYNQLYDYHLRNLNQRIIPALLNFKTPYINTEWWNRWRFDFGRG
jgi:hypothetical protein